jgi:hypothetical protein
MPLTLISWDVSRPHPWLNKYVQYKKMVGKNTHQVQQGRKTMEIVSPIRTTKSADCSGGTTTRAREIWRSGRAELDLSAFVKIPNIWRLIELSNH